MIISPVSDVAFDVFISNLMNSLSWTLVDLEERNVTVFEGLSIHTILTEKMIKSWLGIESEESSESFSGLLMLQSM